MKWAGVISWSADRESTTNIASGFGVQIVHHLKNWKMIQAICGFGVTMVTSLAASPDAAPATPRLEFQPGAHFFVTGF
jgi:hypothetical protein